MSTALDSIRTRDEAVEYLEGYAAQRKDEVDRQGPAGALLKSYLLETVPQLSAEPDPRTIFRAAGVRLDEIGDGMFKVWSQEHQRFMGLVEWLVPRYPVLYTNEDARVSDKWVPHVVSATPFLDRLWLSGRTFYKLWETVLRINRGARYGRLVFEYENVFERDSAGDVEESEDDEEASEVPPADAGQFVKERRASRLTIVDRLEVLSRSLPKLRDEYNPLHSITQLRFPAAGRGGHDFFYNGKVTNRSDSFADHRAHLLYVIRIYKEATENAENAAWYSQDALRSTAEPQFPVVQGAPVIIRFSEELPQDTFDHWIDSIFSQSDRRFRLWGSPIRLGPGTVHVYGADRHLWQPIFLEFSRHHLVALLPKGTCGNTIHRLVTNVQRFIAPAADAWVGDEPYDDFIKHAADSQPEGVHDSNRSRI